MSGKQVPDRMLAHAARAKGACDDFSVCRAFWSFWAPKGHDITTKKRIYDCRLRVSCIKEYKRLFNVLSVLKRYSPYSLQVNQYHRPGQTRGINSKKKRGPIAWNSLSKSSDGTTLPQIFAVPSARTDKEDQQQNKRASIAWSSL